MKPYYEEDGITIYCADCRDVLPTLPKVDLVLTDPPYCDQVHEGARTGQGEGLLISFPSVTSDYLREVFSAVNLHGWIVATMAWDHIADLSKCPPNETRFVRFGIWHKPNGMPQMSGDRPSQGWEGVGILHKGGGRMRWNGGGRHAFWSIPKTEGAHPTTKPLSLFTSFVALFSNEGQTILDPFMGSGTTLVAAKKLDRKAIGIEISREYCDIAIKRLKNTTPSLFREGA